MAGAFRSKQGSDFPVIGCRDSTTSASGLLSAALSALHPFRLRLFPHSLIDHIAM
jgi:hypothetical protein